MATISDLAQDVYVITNRPDLVSETTVAIRKAIRKFHGADLWQRDLRTMPIDLSAYIPHHPNDFRWDFPLTSFERFRRMSDLRAPLGAGSQGHGGKVHPEFAFLTADNLFDQYRQEKQNYFYVAGQSIVVKASWGIPKLEAVYYQWPNIPADLGAPLDSWIASDYPDSIVEEAAASVFKMIGKDDEHNRYLSMFETNLNILRTTDIVQ